MLATLRSVSRLRPRAWAAIVVAALATAGLVAASPASAQPPSVASAQPQVAAFPTPLRFVSFLDLECFRTSPYLPPTTTILTRHLNPVLANLPVETVILGQREKLCVPVAKNNVLPPTDVLNFVRFVDLSCYRIQGLTVNQPLNLRQLNPLLTTAIPPRNVVITTPQHLCVPVIKNGLVPPPEVKQLVAFIDLKCYLEQPPAPVNLNLNLRHLNPVLANLAPHNAVVTNNRQLCVPVQKNNQVIPAAVLNIVRWVDLEMFDIVTPPLATPVNLVLTHLNPALSGLPPEPATIQAAFQLGLPVAKNNLIPPG